MSQKRPEAHLGLAYQRLEPKLCEIKHMANIAAEEISGERNVDEQTMFAVFHLQQMVNTLHAEYMAGFQEGGQ